MPNESSDNLQLFLYFLKELKEDDPKEYKNIEFLETTKEYVEKYFDRAVDFKITTENNLKSKNSKSIILKTIKDPEKNGLVIAFSGKQVIGYTRFSGDQRLKIMYLKGKKINPIEFSEIYVISIWQDKRIGLLLFKGIEEAAKSYKEIDSGILSLSKARAEEHNLIEKYTKMGCDECYKLICNPDMKFSDKVVEQKECLPDNYELSGYIMVDNLYA